MARTGKNTWSLFLLLLAGIVLGSFIAHLTAGVSALSWLSYGKTFGLSSPIVLDLGVLVLTFGLTHQIYDCKHHRHYHRRNHLSAFVIRTGQRCCSVFYHLYHKWHDCRIKLFSTAPIKF